MKVFLDSANLEDIKQYLHLLDGITTNPTSLAREQNDPTGVVKAICTVMHGKDVSVEITEKDPGLVFQQARALAKISDNVVVKIPCFYPYYTIIQKAIAEGIRINITLVFTVAQALYMAKFGVQYISPFVGRWQDIGRDGSMVLYQIRSMIDRYNFSCKLLAASLRDVTQFEQAIFAGADIATISIEVLKKVVTHPLTQQGMERFDADWQQLGVTKFPA